MLKSVEQAFSLNSTVPPAYGARTTVRLIPRETPELLLVAPNL